MLLRQKQIEAILSLGGILKYKYFKDVEKYLGKGLDEEHAHIEFDRVLLNLFSKYAPEDVVREAREISSNTEFWYS